MTDFLEVKDVFERIADGRLSAWPREYFTGEDGIGRLKSVFEMVCTREQIEPKALNTKVIEIYRLASYIAHLFNGSIFAAVDKIWPGRYQPWEMTNVPRNYWAGPDGRKNAVRAIFWLADKLQLRVQDLVRQDYDNNGLGWMLNHVFHGSTRAAAECANESKKEERELKVQYPETEERIIYPGSDRKLTPTEAAERLNVHPSYIRKEIAAGRLPAIDLNIGTGKAARYRISEKDLIEYEQQRRVLPKKRKSEITYEPSGE
jgi:excisionase family DNA binding protein